VSTADAASHDLLVRLAGRLPDELLWRMRDWLADGGRAVLGATLPRELLRHRVGLTDVERDLLETAVGEWETANRLLDAVLPALEPDEPAALGKVGAEVDVDEAARMARICALNALAAVESVIGSLDRVTRIVKVVGFVGSAPDFTSHAIVVNGASELLGDIFGEAGAHARSSVGVAVLPMDAPVEIELIVEFA
jgi:enamine deaminase RidA (YjgF/YER057c/UK114 family)